MSFFNTFIPKSYINILSRHSVFKIDSGCWLLSLLACFSFDFFAYVWFQNDISMLGVHMMFHNCDGNLKLIFNLSEGPVRLTVNSLTKFGRKFQQSQKNIVWYDHKTTYEMKNMYFILMRTITQELIRLLCKLSIT